MYSHMYVHIPEDGGSSSEGEWGYACRARIRIPRSMSRICEPSWGPQAGRRVLLGVATAMAEPAIAKQRRAVMLRSQAV